jgi:protein phosphatase
VGDIFLVCSDGLTGKVKDEELGPILANLPAQEAGRILVDLANLRGGPDNITVIIAKVTGPEITTSVARAEPLKVGSTEEQPTAVHPALWVVMGVCLLAALVMAALGQPIPALLAAIGAVIAATIGVLQKSGSFGKAGVTLSGAHRLGRGPYVEVSCAASREMAENLENLTGELRAAAEVEKWPGGIETIDNHCQQAASATEAGDFAVAVREYCQAISLMMQMLRARQKAKGPSDSSVDL